MLLVFPDCYEKEYIDNYCGKNDCQEDFNDIRVAQYNTTECPVIGLASRDVPDYLLYTLMGIYTGVALVGAALMAFLVDPIEIR